jgi:hypothetical protein
MVVQADDGEHEGRGGGGQTGDRRGAEQAVPPRARLAGKAGGAHNIVCKTRAGGSGRRLV